MKELYQRYQRPWFRLCLRYGRNRNEAEDILQEGLLLVFKDLQQFDARRGEFIHWSNRIMVHAALRYLKKHQWQQSFDDLKIAQVQAEVGPSILDKLSAKELTRVIQQLPAGYRLIFNMYVMEGYSHPEIASMLHISVGTSKSQLAKAKKLLRQKLTLLLQ